MREFAAMGNLEVWYTRLSAASIVERWGDRVDTKDECAGSSGACRRP